MESGLKSKKCLITGGNSGVGFGMAKALAAEGVHLVVAAIDDFPEAMKRLELFGGKVAFIKVDISRESNVVSMVQQAIEILGGLDLFVNNAAITRHQPVTKITSEAFYATIDTQSDGMYLGGT